MSNRMRIVLPVAAASALAVAAIVASVSLRDGPPAGSGGLASFMNGAAFDRVAPWRSGTAPLLAQRGSLDASAAGAAPSPTGAAQDGEPPGGAEPSPGDPREPASVGRRLIYTASVSLEVADYRAAAERIAAMASRCGGYLAETESSLGRPGTRRGTLTVRVPASRFDGALAELRAIGEVRSESSQTQDITKEYADLETRLRVKRDVEARLRQLVRVRAAKVSELVDVERELGRVVEEIERMEGERRYFDQRVALSTIRVTAFEPRAIVDAGSFGSLREALHRSFEVLVTSTAWLVYLVLFLTPWLGLATLGWFAVRLFRGHRPLRGARRA